LLACSQRIYAAPVPTFQFSFSSFSGSSISAAGTFAVSFQSGSTYLITSISGTQNGLPMTLLSPGVFSSNDNLITTASPFIDQSGFSFSLGGPEMYNVFFFPTTSRYFECVNTVNSSCSTGLLRVAFDAAAAPEPDSLVFVGIATLMLVGVMPIRRKLTDR